MIPNNMIDLFLIILHLAWPRPADPPPPRAPAVTNTCQGIIAGGMVQPRGIPQPPIAAWRRRAMLEYPPRPSRRWIQSP